MARALGLHQARHGEQLPGAVESQALRLLLEAELLVHVVGPGDHLLQDRLGLLPLRGRVAGGVEEPFQRVLQVRVVKRPVGQAEFLVVLLRDLRGGALGDSEPRVDQLVDSRVAIALGDDQVAAALVAEHQFDRTCGRHLLLQGIDAVLDLLAVGIRLLRGDKRVDALDDARLLELLADHITAGTLGDDDGDLCAVAVARVVGCRAETVLVELVAEIADPADAAGENHHQYQTGTSAATFLRLLAAAILAGGPGVVVVLVFVFAFVPAREEGVFALVGAGIPVGARLGFGLPAAGWLRGRVGVGRVVVVGLVRGVRGGLLAVRVRGVRVWDMRVRAGAPAALVVRLLGLVVTLLPLVVALLTLAVSLLPLVVTLLTLLVALLALAVTLLALTGVVLLVVALILLRLPVGGLPAVAPVTVVLLLRLLRIVLWLAAVGGLPAHLGLLSAPPVVPVQRVLRVPRFGALAPAILSHRSPRAARRQLRGFWPGFRPASCCAAAVRTAAQSRGTLPYRDQMTTSTPSPGALPDTRSDSRAC